MQIAEVRIQIGTDEWRRAASQSADQSVNQSAICNLQSAIQES